MTTDGHRTGPRIGVMVPASNTNLEPDTQLLHPPELTVHYARVGSYDTTEVPGVEAMRAFADERLEDAVSQLTAAGVGVIAYGCTSATLSGSPAEDRRLTDRVEQLAGVTCITAADCIVAAVRALGGARVVLVSPYVADLREAAAAFLATAAVEVIGNVGPAKDLSSVEQGRLTPADTMRLAKAGADRNADVYVISCTDLRAVEIIPELERELGRPVVTSNQALMWRALIHLGIPTASIAAMGRLAERSA